MKQLKRTTIADALKSEQTGIEINVKGWVRTRRGNKNVSFVALNDGTTINNIQVVIDIAQFGEEYLKPITTGACINVNGKLVESQGQGQSVEIQATEIEIHAKEILYAREQLNKILAKHTKQPLEVINRDTDRDFFMSPEEAMEYGIVDKIIEKR